MGESIIRNLPELLRPYLSERKRIVGESIVKLPPAGVGGLMLKLALRIRDEAKGGSEETLHLVAKMLPQTEFSRKMFKVEYSVLSETGFYEAALPALEEFQGRFGETTIRTSSPVFYGARLNLDGGERLTDDYVLLLEDLSVSGFQNIKRQKGFDLAASKLILRDLAELHATSIALKLHDRRLFDEKIRSICFGLYPWAMIDTMIRPVIASIGRIIERDPAIAHLRDKVCSDQPRPLPGVREPFAALAHCDMWVNNSMQRILDGRVVQNKFVDWAVCGYRSCVSDVFFFIWTSVEIEVIKGHLDELFSHYHRTLLDYLVRFKCDTTPFSYDKFLEEIKLESDYEIGHTLFFIYVCKNYFTLSEHEINDSMKEGSKVAEEVLKNEGLRETVCHFIKECDKRGWL